jgi:SHAQKYF class myb-like DNA-binding protein
LLFIKGLELYGKGWKKIAGLIKTRTVVQIRTHAQKYFLKLAKARQTGEGSGSLSMDGKPLSRKVSCPD